MEKIIPSKPFESYEDVETLAAQVVTRLSRIQVDICDGKFVKSTSWPVSEYGVNNFCTLAQNSELDVFMPRWEEIDYTADLMVLNPELYIDSLVQYGFDEIIVHFRSVKDEKDWAEIFKKAEFYDLKLYLAIDVKTDFKIVEDFLKKNKEKFVGVQVMGIENIGFQGQSFALGSLDLVKNVKKEFPEYLVLFDGAINDETVERIRDAGVDIFCVGSFLTGHDVKEVLKYFREVLGEGSKL